jgi:L-alanine-DL-glutamate epimerase-like enolase superfamily enzyme
MALFDALARSRHVSVATLLGGPVRRELSLVGGIGIDDPDVVAKRAAGMVEAGYRTIKLKIGMKVREDIARVRLVRSVVGDDVAIRVDTNAGYSPPDALLAVRALADLQIEHFEQPVAAEDFDTMARLTRLGAVSILADESVHDAHDAMRIAQTGAADGMKIKISKVGGFIEARKIVDVAEAAGIKVIIGNGICSSIEAAAELQLACTYRHLHPVAEMVGPAKLAGDLAETPFDLSGGTIRLDDGVGLGVTLSHDRLREYAIR